MAERVFFIAVVLLSVAPIWSVYYLPQLDLPQHVLMTHVVAARSYDAGPQYHGHLEFRSLRAPYALLYLAAIPLVGIMPAIYAIKLLLTAAVAGTALALRWLLRRLGRDPWALYFGFPFIFSTLYVAGFISYLMGIPIALVLTGLLLEEPRTTARNWLPRLALMSVLLWAHPVLFAAMAASSALLVALAAYRREITVSNAAAACGWIAAPALYLILWSPSQIGSADVQWWRDKGLQLRLFWYNLGAYNLGVLRDPFWLPKLPLLAWLLWSAARAGAGWRAPSPADPPPEKPDPRVVSLFAVVGLLCFFVAILPEWVSRLMVTPSFRLTPVALLLASALLGRSFTRPPVARILLAMWCVAVLGGNAVLAWRYDRAMDGFVRLVRQMDAQQVVATLYEGRENQLFHHTIAYYHVEKGGISPRTFLNVAYVQHMPAALTPPFPWKGAQWITDGGNPLTDPEGGVFRYVLAKTSRSDAEHLPEVDFPHHRLKARSEGWLLFERKGAGE